MSFEAAIAKLDSQRVHLEVILPDLSRLIRKPQNIFADHIITFTREGTADYGCNVYQ
jgi:hypothetical protein